MKQLAILLIEFYQRFLSFDRGLLMVFSVPGKSCRYFPSCSEYSKLAIRRYGFYKGVKLGFKRIISCH